MNKVFRNIAFLGLVISVVAFVRAGTAPDIFEVQKITENVYALVGQLGDRSPENLSNNATYGLSLRQKVLSSLTPGAPIRVRSVFMKASGHSPGCQ